MTNEKTDKQNPAWGQAQKELVIAEIEKIAVEEECLYDALSELLGKMNRNRAVASGKEFVRHRQLAPTGLVADFLGAEAQRLNPLEHPYYRLGQDGQVVEVVHHLLMMPKPEYLMALNEHGLIWEIGGGGFYNPGERFTMTIRRESETPRHRENICPAICRCKGKGDGSDNK